MQIIEAGADTDSRHVRRVDYLLQELRNPGYDLAAFIVGHEFLPLHAPVVWNGRVATLYMLRRGRPDGSPCYMRLRRPERAAPAGDRNFPRAQGGPPRPGFAGRRPGERPSRCGAAVRAPRTVRGPERRLRELRALVPREHRGPAAQDRSGPTG